MKTIALAAALTAVTLLGVAPASADKELAKGEVTKIDMAQKKITIKHGELPSLDMPAMTMVFRVQDEAMLTQVKPGQKVQFDAHRVKGALTITELK